MQGRLTAAPERSLILSRLALAPRATFNIVVGQKKADPRADAA